MSIKEIVKNIIGSKKKTNSVDVQEAYNLWEGLRSRYDVIEQIQIYESFIYDLDFELVTEGIFAKVIEKQINQLETELNRYEFAC